MIRSIAFGFAVALVIATAASAQTAAPPAGPVADPVPAPASAPPTAAPAYSCAKTDIGDLLDNPATRAVLVKWIPEVVDSPDIKKGRVYTLDFIAPYAPELTPAMLAKIDTDLAKVPRS